VVLTGSSERSMAASLNSKKRTEHQSDFGCAQ
jgi:hypothetical protein